MATLKNTISNKIHVRRRYTRSVDLLRDCTDPEALDGYVLTSSVRDATARILGGLQENSTQKAFRVTGPYGSGKSAFGLFVSRVLEGKEDALRLIAATSIERAPKFPTYAVLTMVGRRTSFTLDLLTTLKSHADEYSEPEFAAQADAIRVLTNTEGDRPTAALGLLKKYAAHIHRKSGRGLAILVDEMGRYLEFAATHPDIEDPSIFQSLAEAAGGRQKTPLAVVAFLHNRFADYVAGLGDWVEAEWTRSAERYEEVSFHESSEQSLYLLSEALRPNGSVSNPIIAMAKRLYTDAGDRRIFALPKADLESLSTTLYPVHPAVAATLAVIVRRLGQNERSMFGFLQTLEPFGFQQFIDKMAYDPKSWYRISDLFDYLRHQSDFRIRSADRARRWQLAVDAVNQSSEMSDLDAKVLKTLAMISVLEPLQGLKADQECLSWIIDEEVDDSLERLISKGLVYKRPHQDDFSLWSSTSVDLDGLLNEAKVRVPAVNRLSLNDAGISEFRPIIAHRHYHKTGTLRAFTITNSDGVKVETDGRIIVLPNHPDEDTEAVVSAAKQLSIKLDSLSLIRIVSVKPVDLSWAHELALWNWVKHNCQELRVDDLARGEVETRIAAAQFAVLDVLETKGDPRSLSSEDTWIHQGKIVEIGSRGQLSKLLSDLCDETFSSAPILRNELINREKLSTAIASARMRLLELMIAKEQEPFLGLEGAPPERTIYLSMLHESGLHGPVEDGQYRLGMGLADPLNWRPAWDLIETMLSSTESVQFSDLLGALRKAPFGLNAGPALILLAVFMLARRTDVALMERNSFQPELTGAHFMRLAKTPKNFALSYLGDVVGGQSIIIRLSEEIEILDDGSSTTGTFKDVAERLYKWWGGLPSVVIDTKEISKSGQDVRSVLRKAHDPLQLFLTDLPSAVSAIDDGGKIDVDRYILALDEALTEIAGIETRLRALTLKSLLDAFGVSSLAALKKQVEADYGPFILQLTEYQPRQFVDRLMSMTNDKIGLDGISGLLVGRRMASWKDGDLDAFAFAAKSMADTLARWLIAVRRQKAMGGNLKTLHIVSTTGREEVIVIRDSARKTSDSLNKRLRAVLKDEDDAAAVLAELLAEQISKTTKSKEKS